jgi:hypothetical protein
MDIPIPTYLIALAAGVIEEKIISKRISVFAEPSMIEKAFVEFQDMENMLQAAEKLFGPYQWGDHCDVLIHPLSFSYGGMENPNLMSIGPTVVAGDKSLVSVVMHEIAHSWAGNWVTNQSWDHLWINEGTTTYIERLLVRELFGEEARKLDFLLGQQLLIANMGIIAKTPGAGNPLTRLRLNLAADFNPEDAISYVPYEKGANFWLALEKAYGLDAVTSFLRGYFLNYAKGVMTTEMLEKELLAFPAFEGCQKVDLKNWFYGEGVPTQGLPQITSVLINQVERMVNKVKMPSTLSESGVKDLKEVASNFNTKQWDYFLRRLEALELDRIRELESWFHLTKKNDEVKSNFFELVIRSKAYRYFAKEIDEYLKVGRIKYVAPIYQALMDMNQRDEAETLYKRHQEHNNAITNSSIERRLGIDSKKVN